LSILAPPVNSNSGVIAVVLITKGLYDPKNGIVKITTDREHILPVSYRGNIESNEEEIEVVVIMTEAKELAV
jgi:hypothetical protein